MTFAAFLLRAAINLAPLVIGKLPDPDPAARERRQAGHAKKRWHVVAGKIHRSPTDPRTALGRARRDQLHAELAKWSEILERLGEDVNAERALFRARLKA